MKISEKCYDCLLSKEESMTSDTEYLEEVKSILDGWGETESAPYMECLLNEAYERRFGRSTRYADVKKEYNEFVLSIEKTVKERINVFPDPLREALFMARTGNYIDFAAMKDVNQDEFLALLMNNDTSVHDEEAYQSFLSACTRAKTFMLVADNCGEAVLDRIMLEKLHERFPDMKIYVLLRGSEVLNDATVEDDEVIGFSSVGEVLSNGGPVAGVVYDMLPENTKLIFDCADLILSKGQGNYETLTGCGKHVFYSFLCKCNVFMEYFRVPHLTGMLVEEK